MKKLIVTAGPTREYLDPVRFLSNKSPGKMGYAIAEAACKQFETVWITGPTALPHPSSCRIVEVVSAEDMYQAVISEFSDCDILIMTAAVADYRPALIADQKLKKGDGDMVLQMERTKDILGEVSKLKNGSQKVMGFAAETENIIANAKNKLERKKLDWIVANDVSSSETGFASDNNKVTVISKDKQTEIPTMSKKAIAEELIQIIKSV